MNAAASVRTPANRFDDGPGKTATIMIWEGDAAVQKTWRWGFHPIAGETKPISLLRSEKQMVVRRPCLIIANEFFVTPDGSKKRHRVTYLTDEPFFCFAGVWAPAQQHWPEAFAALTVDSSPDIAPLKDRHMAVVRQDDWEAWLRQTKPVEEVLRPFPPGSFRVEGQRAGAVADLFSL